MSQVLEYCLFIFGSLINLTLFYKFYSSLKFFACYSYHNLLLPPKLLHIPAKLSLILSIEIHMYQERIRRIGLEFRFVTYRIEILYPRHLIHILGLWRILPPSRVIPRKTFFCKNQVLYMKGTNNIMHLA